MKTIFSVCLVMSLAVGWAAEQTTNAVLITPEFVEALAAEARTNNPALRAADLRADAAVWNAASVRTWEDPTAKFGVMGAERARRSDDGDLIYGIDQKLPLWGKPRAARELAQSEAIVQRHDANYRGHVLRRDVVKQLLRVALSERLLQISREDLVSLDTTVVNTEAKFRDGFASQVEVLQAQNERSRRANMLRTDEKLLEAERVSLNRFLGREPKSLWLPLLLPAIAPELPAVDELLRHASQAAPQLSTMRAAQRQADLSVEVARLQRRPEVSVGLEGRQYADTGEFREGLFTLGVTIPWGNRSRYNADVKREQRKAEAARLDIADMQLAIRDEVVRHTILIENAAREAHLYRSEIIPRTQQSLESAQANWLNNRGMLRDVLEARRLLLEARAAEARAVAEQHSLLAELALHCGMSDWSALQAKGTR